MAYWIQEISTTQNMSNYRLFHCDYRSDIDKLPKFGIEGELQENDTISHKPCSYGSQALVLQDSSTWELGKATNEWKELKTIVVGGNSGNGSSYILPVAGTKQLGGVMIGNNIDETPEGTISVNAEKIVQQVTTTENEVNQMLNDIFGTK